MRESSLSSRTMITAAEMERMFMEIFERKDWISSQLRQQVESYSESVATNMLASGRHLPLWLRNAAPGPNAWNTRRPQGLNRESLMSGIHNNFPQFTTPMNYTTYPSHSFQYNRSDLSVLQGMNEPCPDKDDDACIVMDSYDRMRDPQTDHKNKKIKHCDALRSVAEYTGRMTRSKAHKQDDHQKKAKRMIEFSGRMTRSKLVKVEQQDQFKSQIGIECLCKATRSETEKNDDHLRNRMREIMRSKVTISQNGEHSRKQSGEIKCSSKLTRSKSGSVKHLNIKVPLELKNLTEGETGECQYGVFEQSLEIRSKSIPLNDENRSNIDELGASSKSCSKEDDINVATPCSRSSPEKCQMAEEREVEEIKEDSACLRCPLAEEEEAKVDSPCYRSPSAGEEETKVDSPCLRSPSAEAEETKLDSLCLRNPSAEEEKTQVDSPCRRSASPMEEEAKEDSPCVGSPSAEDFFISSKEEENKMGSPCRRSPSEMEMGSSKHRSPSVVKCQTAEEEKMEAVTLSTRKECEMVDGNIGEQDSCNDNPSVEFSTLRKVNGPSGLVCSDESQSQSCQKISYGITAIKQVLEENRAEKDMNSPDLIPAEHFSCSYDVNMDLSEDNAPELEGFSVEKPVMEDGFIFDLSNIAKFELQDDDMICDEMKRSDVVRDDVIMDDADPEMEGFSIDNPIFMTELIFNDPELQKLSRERNNALKQLQICVENQDLEILKSAEKVETLETISAENVADMEKSPEETGDTRLKNFDVKALPFTPPVERFQHRALLERESTMEHACFSIYENSKPRLKEKRKPLTDMTSSYQNNTSFAHPSKITELKKSVNERKMSLRSSSTKNKPVVLEKKATNIVSNIQSFIPLVRPKQQALAPAAGKREVKVKALEAAETAKKLAEKKEMERKMKKEAMKIERMKAEQDNARQLALKQKQKEEERKKKEAAIVARKRQREDEMREKQRKKNCPEGATRRAPKERESRKGLLDEAVQDREKIQSWSNLHQNRRSDSYEISPYRDSDDEEFQDEKRQRKKKFIPSWVSRESLDGHLISMREMDPVKIFSRKASFNISEVLPYRTRMALP